MRYGELALQRLELDALRPDAEHLVADHREVRVLVEADPEGIDHRVGIVDPPRLRGFHPASDVPSLQNT